MIVPAVAVVMAWVVVPASVAMLFVVAAAAAASAIGDLGIGRGQVEVLPPPLMLPQTLEKVGVLILRVPLRVLHLLVVHLPKKKAIGIRKVIG